MIPSVFVSNHDAIEALILVRLEENCETQASAVERQQRGDVVGWTGHTEVGGGERHGDGVQGLKPGSLKANPSILTARARSVVVLRGHGCIVSIMENFQGAAEKAG